MVYFKELLESKYRVTVKIFGEVVPIIFILSRPPVYDRTARHQNFVAFKENERDNPVKKILVSEGFCDLHFSTSVLRSGNY